MSEIAEKLDQYYTKDDIADTCFKTMTSFIGEKIDFNHASFLEPSAGGGAFVRAIKANIENPTIIALDIDPHNDEIVQKDFFEFDRREFPSLNAPIITVGNPPFGKRSKTAKLFFQRAAEFSDVIAFIVPKQFEKWSVQKDLSKEFALVLNEQVEPKSFTLCGKEVSIRCVFQVWIKKDYDFEDLRLKEAPPTKHKDFELYQYNNTITAQKYFDYDWDFCLPRQGFYDYSKKGQIAKKDQIEKCNYKIQYMFFKARNEIVLHRLKNLDYESLAKKNTTVPGFGKADVIMLYQEVYGNE